MRAKIHNRSGEIPADGWFQIEVTGEHPAGANRKQVIDAVALAAIVNRFQADAADENFAGMLVDNDHLSHDLTQSTEALAWARELAIRNGELHGRLELTDTGEAAVKHKRFKFFSTEYDPEDLQDLGDGRVRPLRLSGLAFTNRPNNRGGKPISNRKTPATEPASPKNMKNIANKLSLPDDADEAAIIASIETLLGKLKAAEAAEAGTSADAIMNRLGKRVPEAVRPLWREKLIANRAETEPLMEASFPAVAAVTPQAPIHNRSGAVTPEPVSDGTSDAAAADANKKAAAIRNRAGEISRTQKIPFNQAFNLAKSELA